MAGVSRSATRSCASPRRCLGPPSPRGSPVSPTGSGCCGARRQPVVSITGTNGKTTTTRLIAHILRTAGNRVGATTSDGIVVGRRIVEPGDWTGPGGAGAILGRDDIDIAVLETARGGILLRG